MVRPLQVARLSALWSGHCKWPDSAPPGQATASGQTQRNTVSPLQVARLSALRSGHCKWPDSAHYGQATASGQTQRITVIFVYELPAFPQMSPISGDSEMVI